MLKIWGRNTSINVQKVMWAIGELGIAHERINVGGAFGKNNEPAYLAMNPNGLVPTLEEDDFILWESNAIVRYLAAKYGAGTLEPKDPRARASAGRWMDWQLSVTAPTIHPLFWGLVRTPPEKRDQAKINDARDKTTAIARTIPRVRCVKFMLFPQIPRHGEVPLRWAGMFKSEAGNGDRGCGPRSRGCDNWVLE